MIKGFINNKWTLENVIILKFLHPNTKNSEIGQLLGFSTEAIVAKAFKMGLKKDEKFIRACGVESGFAPGQTPFNKGLKWTDYLDEDAINNCSGTCFKPGAEHPNFDKFTGNIYKMLGYYYKRIGPYDRRLFHHFQYEEFIGEIPNGHIVIFKDGDPENCHPFNLECISMAENLKRNTIQRFPPELVTVIKLLSKLKKQIKNGKKQDVRPA